MKHGGGIVSMHMLKKENLIPEQRASHQPFKKLKAPDMGGLISRVPASKFALGLLALLALLDSFLASRTASPGYDASLFLSWALVTRLWLVAPSRPLLFFCLVISVACVSANRGLLTGVGVLHSVYVYLVSALLIVFWERLKGLLGLAR